MALRSDGSAGWDEPIAIIGTSCRFPGADGIDAFWQLLVKGVDAVSEIDAQRWATRFFYHPDGNEPGKSYSWAAALINDIDRFEPAFFGISPREAAQMDPQQRVLLELVWHAFEDAGIPPSRARASEMGVFIGASATDYSDLGLGDPAAADAYFMTGNALSIVANRISYVFDLRGPSLAIDTACSSSLVALHQACEALRSRRIPSAIVGGINLLLTPYPFLGFCRASMLSHRGRCFAFDARADGYVRGEGGAIVILKPLAMALADGDPIRALIIATGCNSDGRTIGLSLPSEAAQTALLTSVYRDCGTAADDLAFFEMHGTGTPAGDPLEAAAVGRVLGSQRREPLPIGSVKTNIGHLEPASGMAGLLKAALALDAGIVPPTLHCETPNPAVDFTALNLRLVRTPEPIAVAAERRIAGVNSFGFGGTNAHAVLAPPPQRVRMPPAVGGRPPALVVSAASEASLRALALGWRERIAAASDAQLAPLLRAAARNREHHRHRLVALGADSATLGRLLDGFTGSAATSETVTGTALAGAPLAFVFAGNGAQFPGMGRAALRANPVFRAAIEELDAVLKPLLGWSVAALIEAGIDADAVARADIAQPVLFAIQVGIVETLRAAGITAAGHCGHSVGEIAAAWAAGALSLGEAARIIVARSRSQQATAGTGRMAALGLGAASAVKFLAEIGNGSEIAAFNADHSVTVAGSGDEIADVIAAARDRGIWCRPLDLDFAFHSRMMEPVRDKLLADLRDLAPKPPSAKLASTVSGAIVDRERLNAEHWWRNIRNPVRFDAAMAALIAKGFRIFVQIGPSSILRSYVVDGLRSADCDGRVVATLTRSDGDADPFTAIAARCWVAGGDWTAAPGFAGTAELRGLPLYPWDRQRYWRDKTVEAADLVDSPFDHPLLGFRQRGHWPNWLNHLDAEVLPWLADHAVDGVAIFPAAAILELAFAAAHWHWPNAPVLEAVDVDIIRPMPFESGVMRELRVALISDEGDWELVSRPRLARDALSLHAAGRIAAGRHSIRGSARAASTALECIGPHRLYRLANRLGLNYGRRFRTVERVEILAPDHAVVHLDPTKIGEPVGAYLMHPALLDGALHGLLALLVRSSGERPQNGFLPSRFGRVRLAAPYGRVCRQAELHLTRLGVRSASANLTLYDEAGELVAELTDCWFQRVALHHEGSADQRLFRVDWIPAPLVETEPPAILPAAGRVLKRLAQAQIGAPERREQAALLNALIGAAAYRFWKELVEPEQPFTLPDLVHEGRLSAAASGLAEALLQAAERLGAAVEFRGEWRISSEAGLPEAGEIWRLLLAEAPDLVAELAVLGDAFERLPEMLAGGRTHSPSASTPVEQLLEASPASAASIDILGQALRAIAAEWPKGRPLRILEIGARPSVTRRLWQCLATTPAAIAYVAACPDPQQTSRLSALAQSFAGARACCWNPEGSIEPIGDARFDIVLAPHTFTCSKLDAPALGQLGQLLAPGGVFIAIEPEPNALWDIVFAADPDPILPDRASLAITPLRSRDAWQAELTAVGFCDCGTVGIADGPWPIAAIWGTAPAGIEPCATERLRSRAVAVVLEDSPLSRALNKRLEAEGHRVVTVLAGDSTGTWPACAPDGDSPDHIVFIARKIAATGELAEEIAALSRVAHYAAAGNAALSIVTGGGQKGSPDAFGAGIAGAAISAFARVLANELPELSLRTIEFATTEGVDQQARHIAEEIAANSPETEIVWGTNGRHAPRLRPGLPQPSSARDNRTLILSASPTGSLQSLHWALRGSAPLAPGEVEIDVHAAGLNFRDVMWAMGLLPEEALADGFAGPTFGLECAGVVRAVGAGVEHIRPGQRVMALAPAALSTRVVTPVASVVPLAAGLGFAAAATLPVAFVTVIYALGHLAQLGAGDYVLVHAAAGGVGLAAIQYAKHNGAVVIATAGSATKRAFLRLAGADHVLDSRDLGFADRVRAITGGRGVDVVLNSLSGEGMERSLELLKPFGRFLELGKRDFYRNRRLHLRPLRNNISYFAIDIDQLPRQRPTLARSLLTEIGALLKDGAIRPLAYRTFLYSEVEDAFRLMQASGHLGKLVLVPDHVGEIPVHAASDFMARRDGTYLVTGGIEGFGFEAARWLADHGAGAIALLGRRGAQTPGCSDRVAELTTDGVEVGVYSCDIANPAALAAVLAEIRATQPPLRGVIHAAATIEDGLAADIDDAGIARVLEPKVAGALALDQLTRDDPIDFFILFSSATTLLGAPGQGAYVAANAALEALARRRHAEGRPALAVAWGPIADAGYLVQRPEVRDRLAHRLGAVPTPAAQALAELPAMLASGVPVITCASAQWHEARNLLPTLSTPFFSEVRDKNVDGSGSDEALAKRVRQLDPHAAQALLQHVITTEIADILRLPALDVDPARPLSEMGMDSLMAVELRLALERRLHIDLPLMSLAEGTSITAIAGRLARLCGPRGNGAELAQFAARYETSGGFADAAAAVIDASATTTD